MLKKLMLKKRMVQGLVLLGAVGLTYLIASQQKQNMPIPDSSLTMPIKLDKAGNKASLYFWIDPKDSHPGNGLLIVLGRPIEGGRGDVVNLFYDLVDIPMKVTVERLNDSINTAPVRMEGYLSREDVRKISKLAPSGSILFPYLYAVGENQYAVIDRETEHGFYRAEIETVKDIPEFKDVDVNFSVYYGRMLPK